MATRTSAEILQKIPEEQRPAAAAILAEFGPQLLRLAQEDVLQYIERIRLGDFKAVADLLAASTDAEFLASVRANSARWENVANYNVVREELGREFLLRATPIVFSILLALLGF